MIDLKECSSAYIMPESLARNEKVISMGYALQKTAQKILEKTDMVSVYSGVDYLPEEVVDLLAVELRAQYYDFSMSVADKREAVKKAMSWYEMAGTLHAVKELTEFVWGRNCDIEEWFQYGGRPYTFRIYINDADNLITEDGDRKFMMSLQNVKNTRSLLEAIIFRREQEKLLYIGSADRSYTRQVIVDYYDEDRVIATDANASAWNYSIKYQNVTEV